MAKQNKTLQKQIDDLDEKFTNAILNELRGFNKEFKENSKKESGFSKFIKGLIPFISLVVAVFSFFIAKSSMEISKSNMPLIHETDIKPFEKGKLIVKEGTKKDQEMTIPLMVNNQIKTGKIKVIYIITNDHLTEEPHFTRLEPDSEKNFNYVLSANSENINKEILDFFVYYIDINNEIKFDYVVIFPEYEKFTLKLDLENTETKKKEIQERPKFVLKKITNEIFNRYDFVTKEEYEGRLKARNNKGEFEGIKDYDEVKKSIEKNDSLLSTMLEKEK